MSNRVAAVLLPLLLLASLSLVSQTVSFSSNSFGSGTLIAHGDFNNDGREDFVEYGTNAPGYICCFAVYSSTGDGSYYESFSRPVLGWGPGAGDIVVGDFNGDGNLDIALVSGSNAIDVYLGNGNGTFSEAITTTFPTANEYAPVAAADLNRDGKTDLILAAPGLIRTFYSNGDGTFRTGPTTSVGVAASHVLVGDFDGNGVTDIATYFTNPSTGTVQVTVMYGSGSGTFPGPWYSYGLPTATYVTAADLNGDGRTDLIAPNETDTSSGRMPQPSLSVLYGTSGHGLTTGSIALSQGCAGPRVDVADFTGHGRGDVVVPEVACGQPLTVYSPTSWYIKPNLGGGSFGAEQFFYTTGTESGIDTMAVRLNWDTEPDVAFSGNGAAYVLMNTTLGNFPTCRAPFFTARGINVCAPAEGGGSSTPVRFAIGAAGASPMRDIEVWVDGTKRAEQIYGFSHYTFMEKNISLSAGNHNVTVVAAGWDQQVQKQSFKLSVGQCSVPAAPGVNICAPIDDQPCASPVQVNAAARVSGTISRMELWDNGVKRYTAYSTTHLSHAQSLTPGLHNLTVYAINTAGTKWSSSVTANVQ